MAESKIPETEPAWFKKVNETLNELVTSVKFANNSLEDLKNEMQDLKRENVTLKQENKAQKGINNKLQLEVNTLRQHIENLETYSRKYNLLIDGIKELQNESAVDTERLIIEKISRCYTQPIFSSLIKRAHRIGPKKGANASPRQIIVRFCSLKVRDTIWANRFKLKNTLIFLSEDFPLRVREVRKKLLPYYLAARKLEVVKSCKLTGDKLLIDSKPYTPENIQEAPVTLEPRGEPVKEADDVLVFSSKRAIFSNLYEAEITIDGQKYNTNEQFIQFSKSRLFKDKVTMDRILNETDPYKQMTLGRSVRNFDIELWNAKSKEILFEANFAKYNQHKDARDALINTKSKKLGEATTHKKFGVGLRINSKDILNTELWSGENIMGSVLEHIRSRLTSSTN